MVRLEAEVGRVSRDRAQAAQVVDSFHVISLANRALGAVRRRVQNEQTGHRGRRHDPLYRARRALLVGTAPPLLVHAEDRRVYRREQLLTVANARKARWR